MSKLNQKLKGFKKGAASYYIVAFSTLILVILSTSFAMVIISEISRTSNDDLSQSAYDSALAGTEDAKVAYANYRRCVEVDKKAARSKPTGTGPITCEEIIWWMEHPDCYMVGHILGKIPKDAEEEVKVGGEIVAAGSKETTTNQAYTCTKINTNLYDYRSTITAYKKIQTFKASSGHNSFNNVDKLRISWYSVRSDVKLTWANFSGYRVRFPKLSDGTIAVPPTIEVKIMQTAERWRMSDFDLVEGNNTDRATMYFVPTNNVNMASKGDYANFIGIYDGRTNYVTADKVAKTNNRYVENKSFLTYCEADASAEFYCTAEIELPGVIGGRRSNDTFMVSVSLPYQQPDTDFSVELLCRNGTSCTDAVPANNGASDNITKITNSQISIDSTGRANDLYRRVETRLETADTNYGSKYPYYALEILGDGVTEKDMKVTSEHNFYF